METSLLVQWLRLHAPYAGGTSSIPGQGTRSHQLQLRVHMPQIKILHAATKNWCSQMNFFFFLSIMLFLLSRSQMGVGKVHYLMSVLQSGAS